MSIRGKIVSTSIAGVAALGLVGGIASPSMAAGPAPAAAAQKADTQSKESTYLVKANADSMTVTLSKGYTFIKSGNGEIQVRDSKGNTSALPSEVSKGVKAHYTMVNDHQVNLTYDGAGAGQPASSTGANGQVMARAAGECESGYLNALGEGAAGGAFTGGASGAFAAGVGAVPGAAAGAVTGSIVGVLAHAGNNVIQHGGAC